MAGNPLGHHGNARRSRINDTAARRRVLPGFGLTLGYTMVYLSLMVLIPLSAVFIRSMGWDGVTSGKS